MNLAEAERMVAVARASRRIFGVAYYRRAYPKVHRAMELIRRGAIGQPVLAWATCHSGPIATISHRSWLLDPARASGGPLFDIASHRIDILNFFFGEPARAAGQLSSAVHALAVEDSATVMTEYKNRLRAIVDVRWPHLRPVLHHQAGGAGDRSGPRHRSPPGPSQRWRNLRGVAAGPDGVPGRPAARGDAQRPNNVMNKPVLLIVDDDPQVLAAVRRDLRLRYREHYTVMSAASGEEALATARELKTRGDSLALVISDQRMPGMPGSEVLARSREVYPLARRILLTAYSDIEAAVKAINEAHLDYYLSKPWDPPEERLFPVIDDLLDAWQAEYLPEAKGLRLVGDQWSPRSHAIKDFLAGNLIPYRWLDVTRNEDARVLLEAAGVGSDELPALFFDDGSTVLPGGQAGTSSRIENYLGFPTGVSGSDLTRRALMQAQRLGAEFLAPLEATGISIDAGYKRLRLADGRELVTRALLAATGMLYREHPALGVTKLTGAGVYYRAAITEAPAISGRRVLVVGGGNSAGQGAMYLARHAKEVEIVIRRDGLRGTMSPYLIDQIAKTPNIRLRPRTQVERVEGEGHLERVAPTSLDDGSCRVEEADALFVFIGTHPRSDWLPPEVLRDAKGFVLTGRDLMVADGYARIWKERREPLPLETSVPGVFAAGDLRAGAMNRVASAVGEGSMVVRLAHDYLALT